MEEIQRKRSFQGVHGPVLRSGNTTQDLGKPSMDPHRNLDPLLLLKEHIVVNDTRIVDKLREQDTAQTMSVTLDQFVQTLQVCIYMYRYKHALCRI